MYQHVLLVTDLRADTDLVAERAKWIMDKEPECQLTVLHIVEDSLTGSTGYEFVPQTALYDRIDNERLQLARTRLAQMISRNDLRAFNLKIQTALSGRQGILDYCQAHPVDLVVIGRHKRKGLSAWILGATADSILPDVDADLLVVPLAW